MCLWLYLCVIMCTYDCACVCMPIHTNERGFQFNSHLCTFFHVCVPLCVCTHTAVPNGYSFFSTLLFRAADVPGKSYYKYWKLSSKSWKLNICHINDTSLSFSVPLSFSFFLFVSHIYTQIRACVCALILPPTAIFPNFCSLFSFFLLFYLFLLTFRICSIVTFSLFCPI